MALRAALLVFLLLPLIALTQANVGVSDFIEPVEEMLGVEYYEFEGERYGIFTQKMTWSEANQLCPTKNGSLVDFEASGVAEFIARALAESAVGFGALWIGGLLDQPDNTTDGVWKWARSKNVIDSTLAGITAFPMDHPPYWVDKPEVKSHVSLCLGTDRKLHHLPLIVSVDCQQKRPYICKLPPATSDGKGVLIPPPITIDDKRYHLFHGQFTWPEALSQCLLLGMKLAKLTTAKQFHIIGNRMRRARPIMENAWIGGEFINGAWHWASSNEVILVDEGAASETEPLAWYRPKEIIKEGCLLADRHVCDHFVYVEAKCDRRRPYICEEDLKTDGEDHLLRINGSDLWVSTYIETWFKAQNACKECVGGKLVHIKHVKAETLVQLPELYQGMAITTGIEIRHVWIGGYLFDKEFKWTDETGNEMAGATALTQASYEKLEGDKGLLEYCKIDMAVDTFLLIYKCLNMDRENQKNFFMYGLQCDLKQHFICEAPAAATLNIGCKKKNSADDGPTQPTTKKE